MSRESEYIIEARIATRKVWEGVAELVALQREWNALDYGTTLDEDTEHNPGVLPAEVGSVVFDSANAFVAVLNAGHATNLAKLL